MRVSAMRLFGAVGVLAILGVSHPAKADESDWPDSVLALFAGAATNLVGMAVGGTILATSHGTDAVNNGGWLAIEGAFTMAPLVAHGVVGEWGRGALFAGIPAATLGGTAALFGLVPDTVDHGTLPQQRIMWSLFGVGLLASAVGVVDTAFARSRARGIMVTPTLGAGQVGLQIGGVL